MIRINTLSPWLIGLAAILCSCMAHQADLREEPRSTYDFDFNWKFKLGDFPEASAMAYQDDDWRTLNVPHDWSIEGDYDRLNPAGMAGGFLPTGIGWYRKHFQWMPEWKGKKVSIEFDGVYCNSTVWINGTELGSRPNGYINFSYDLTAYLRKGENVISVRVDHSQSPTGRWYTGSGIYRHVKLLVTGEVYVPRGGLFVTTPEINERSAEISTTLEVVNEREPINEAEISYSIWNKSGSQIFKTASTHALKAGENQIQAGFSLANPDLWSPDHPYLYTLVVTIASRGRVLDEYQSTFGVRSIHFSTENGFLLNGVKTILKGVCNHHDAGPVGAAVPNDVLYRRLRILKNMGCNAIRTSHNPFAPEFYAMCDSMGFLVMNEAFDGWETEKAKFDYGHYFEDWWDKDLEAFVKRDRNHPSVIIWSIGNEVRGYTDKTQKRLVDFVKALDPTRPVTQGRGYRGPAIDLAGFNGHGEYKDALKHFHEKHPTKPIIGTEITHGMQTRGVYRTKTQYRRRDNPAPWEKGKPFGTIADRVYQVDDLTEEEVFKGIDPFYHSSYDNSIVRMGIRDYWKVTKDLTYFLGAFRWTGFDYLGESFGWPARTMSFGVIDLAGFPTDNYYLYQSIWSDEPMVHLLPHWTHPGKEGVKIPVVVYTNCGSAELFLNGKSLGEKPMTDDLQMVWMVPYAPGELKVVAKTDGDPVATKIYQTAGDPYSMVIQVDRSTLLANHKDVVHAEISVIDKYGVEVPAANHLLTFDIEGPGKLIGVENGDILDLGPHKVNHRKAFHGKCLALVQATGDPGEIILTVNAEGLQARTVKIMAKTPAKSL